MVQINPTTAGRSRPQANGFELFVWYLMRVTGVALFVLALAHFSIMHFVFDPAKQDATWIAGQRWNSLFWRSFDWLLLMTVLFHSFMGVRTVLLDYVHGARSRLISLSFLYLLAAALFVIGTSVVLTLPSPGGI
jgi:succinate dehydrogenase / fumarate reductase, membrane anchor subunit